MTRLTSLPPPEKKRSFHAVLRESLASYLSVPMQHKVVNDALMRSRCDKIPEDGAKLQVFIQALRLVIEQSVGCDVSSAVTAELMPYCSLAHPEEDTAVRRRRKAKGSYKGLKAYTSQELRELLSTRPPPFAKIGVVVIASSDGQRIARVEARVGKARKVHAVIDLLSLVDFIERGPVLLIVDFSAPTIQFTTLTTLAADLPGGSVVILWGDPNDDTILAGASVAASNWYRCSKEAEPEDIAALCQLVLE